jgi:hydroxymethylglutaryl-CoA lyase
MPESIAIRDVGPRDGLQAEAPVPVEARIRIIDGLLAAGVSRIEICSFVSPKAVPAMAGAGEVVAAVAARGGVVRTALVPNLKGAQLALAAAVDEITLTVSASEEYSRKNTHMSLAEAITSCRAVCVEVAGRVPLDVVISCAFGSPYEGEIAPSVVADVADRLIEAGASRLTLADTTGVATPRRVREILSALSDRASHDVGLHFHETRGTALLNAYAGMQLGVRRFDTSVGGLGGSPFAAGAAGNLATEDLVYLCDDLGIATGINLDRLLEVAALTAEVVGHRVPSRISAAGPRTKVAGSGG